MNESAEKCAYAAYAPAIQNEQQLNSKEKEEISSRTLNVNIFYIMHSTSPLISLSQTQIEFKYCFIERSWRLDAKNGIRNDSEKPFTQGRRERRMQSTTSK